MVKVFSLNTIHNRVKNLDIIIPIILEQADKLYVNLIGYKEIPEILNNDKITVNQFDEGGSELRFYNYNDDFGTDEVYYFTIDDDILYPDNYSEVMINKMIEYDNKVVCCLHGSMINFKVNSNYYKNRYIYNYKDEIKKDFFVHIPGVGTTCFYKKNFKVNLEDFKVRNMSDPYIASFLFEQNIKPVSIARKRLWLKDLNMYGTSIFGNNPHKDIDDLINNTFKKKDKPGMKVIMYNLCYNEEKLLPWKHKYCKDQNIELFVIDNYSTDGSVDYMNEHGIRYKQVDTKGAFDLRILLKETNKQIKIDKPDWFVFAGMDLFFINKDYTIFELCDRVGKKGFSMIEMGFSTFYHTEESDDYEGNPFEKYFYCNVSKKKFKLISDKNGVVGVDTVTNRHGKVYKDGGMIFEMQAYKDIKNRFENLERRKEAWKKGMNKNQGVHYVKHAKKGFLWNKDKLTDIRKNKYYELYKKLQSL